MLTLVTIPAADVERLAAQFGDRVRRMGKWNASGDRSLEIPITVIREAAAELGNDTVAQAARELKSEQVTRMFESSSAACTDSEDCGELRSLFSGVDDTLSKHPGRRGEDPA